jgi:hypothetical protein
MISLTAAVALVITVLVRTQRDFDFAACMISIIHRLPYRFEHIAEASFVIQSCVVEV